MFHVKRPSRRFRTSHDADRGNRPPTRRRAARQRPTRVGAHRAAEPMLLRTPRTAHRLTEGTLAIQRERRRHPSCRVSRNIQRRSQQMRSNTAFATIRRSLRVSTARRLAPNRSSHDQPDPDNVPRFGSPTPTTIAAPRRPLRDEEDTAARPVMTLSPTSLNPGKAAACIEHREVAPRDRRESLSPTAPHARRRGSVRSPIPRTNKWMGGPCRIDAPTGGEHGLTRRPTLLVRGPRPWFCATRRTARPL